MFENNPLVSIIMGVHLDEGTLSSSIKSILNQSYNNFEFIIVNDGNDKEVTRVVNRIDDPRITLINQEKIGLTACLNIGIENSNGIFIARQDAGDFSQKRRLQTQVDYMLKHPSIALCGTFVNEKTESGHDLGITTFPTENTEIKKNIISKNTFCHGSIMINKEVLIEVGGYREDFTRAQDFDLWLRVIDRFKVANLDLPLYSRTISKNSISFKHGQNQDAYADVAIKCYRARLSDESEPLHLLKDITDESLNEKQSNKVEVKYNFYCGRKLYQNENMKVARGYFLKAFKLSPLSFKNTIFLLLTFLPKIIRTPIAGFWFLVKKLFGLKIV